MSDESPTLEERVGWLEDRMDAVEMEVTVAKKTLADSDTASLMLFNGLVSFLVKEKLFERQVFTSYMQAQVELADLEIDHPTVLRFVRGRIDGLMTEESDEIEGRDMDEERRALLRRLHRKEGSTERSPDDGE